MRVVFWSLVAAALVAPLIPASGHEGTHVRIDARSQQIHRFPDRADLFLDRAELYREHGDLDAAFVDLARADTLVADHAELDLARGRLFLDAGWPRSASYFLQRFLARHPDHAEARQLHAAALSALGRHLPSATEYGRAISSSSSPIPEWYIARSNEYVAAGDAYLDEALAGLDEGMAAFGKPLVTLQTAAIDIELRRKAFDRALERLETLAAQSPRKETWLARRGEMLEEAGRPDDARRAYEQALAAAEALPLHKRETPAVVSLIDRVRSNLARIARDDGQAEE